MARKIHQSNLEIFVDAWLKRFRNTNKRGNNRKYIQKALVLIDLELGIPCCIDPEATVDLITPKENTLTRTVHNLLIGIDRRRHKKSLNRIKDALNAILVDPCCI